MTAEAPLDSQKLARVNTEAKLVYFLKRGPESITNRQLFALFKSLLDFKHPHAITDVSEVAFITGSGENLVLGRYNSLGDVPSVYLEKFRQRKGRPSIVSYSFELQENPSGKVSTYTYQTDDGVAPTTLSLLQRKIIINDLLDGLRNSSRT